MTAIAQKVGCSGTCERPSLVFGVDLWVAFRTLRGNGVWILMSMRVIGSEKRVQVHFWCGIMDSIFGFLGD